MNELENKYNEIEKTIKNHSNEMSELLNTILSYCLDEVDFETANKLCRLYISSSVDNFVYIGIVCAEHITRVYGKLVDNDIIQKIIYIACGCRGGELQYDAQYALNHALQSRLDYDIYSLYKDSPLKISLAQRFYKKEVTVNPFSLLSNSERLNTYSSRLMAEDRGNSRYFIFDEYLPGKYFYHSRNDDDLSPKMSDVLINVGAVPDNGLQTALKPLI
jgi:hypothetical protein